MDALKIPEDQPIESGMVSKSIEQAQSKVEGFHFDQRKRVVEYDDVMNKQREIIYKRRLKILNEADEKDSAKLKERIIGYIEDEINGIVLAHESERYSQESCEFIVKEFMSIIPFDKTSQGAIIKKLTSAAESEKIIKVLTDIVEKTYADRELQMGEQNMRTVERFVMLSSIDRMWMNHLDEMDDLREGIWLRGSKETVLSEYKKEAFDMFGSLLEKINAEVTHHIFRMQVTQMARPTVPANIITGKDEDFATPRTETVSTPSTASSTTANSTSALAAALGKTAQKSGKADGRTPVIIDPDTPAVKIGRNDPCPCGSGKKWKKCGLINAPSHKA
jgi:preprotein translocase subunit SecA